MGLHFNFAPLKGWTRYFSSSVHHLLGYFGFQDSAFAVTKGTKEMILLGLLIEQVLVQSFSEIVVALHYVQSDSYDF